MNFSICFLLFAMAVIASADSEFSQLIIRKKFWGPPEKCYMFVRKQHKQTGARECLHFATECSNDRELSEKYEKMTNEECETDKSFTRSAENIWTQKRAAMESQMQTKTNNTDKHEVSTSRTEEGSVDFPTALDVYIWICYSTLFICMVEFTVVHYYTKFNTGDPEIQELEREKMRQIIRGIPKKAILSSRYYNRPLAQKIRERRTRISRTDGGRHSMIHRKPTLATVPERRVLTPQLSTSSSEDARDKAEFHRENVGWRLYYWMMDHGKRTDPFGLAENSISVVDRFARIALPIIFIIVVLLYYNFYVNTPFSFTFDDSFETHHF